MGFAAFLEDLPLLHTWDLGKTWNTGGFQAWQLKRMHELLTERFSEPVRVLETGAGNSTITFLQVPNLEQLVTIAPSAELRDRILGYCEAHGIGTDAMEYRLERSEIALPSIAFGAGGQSPPDPGPHFDAVLIDGGHGWPTVFVDFCYANLMMRKGSLLFLDDTQLYSVAEISRLLELQPGFTLREELAKLQIWEKDDNQAFLPEHSREPYIIEQTRIAASS